MKLSKTKIKTNLVIINIQHFQQKVNSFREKNKNSNNNKQQIAEKRIELSTESLQKIPVVFQLRVF